MTLEDTISDGDDTPVDVSHRNFDQIMEDTSPGTHFNAAFKLIPGCKRRQQSRLGVSRVPFIEPIGDSREDRAILSMYVYKYYINLYTSNRVL